MSKKTSIRVSEDNLSELHKIKGKIEVERGTYTTLDDALNEVIQAYKKRHK